MREEWAVVPLDDDGPGVFLFEAPTALSSHLGAQVVIDEQCFQFTGEVLRVTRYAQQPCRSIQDRVGNTADPTGHDGAR